MKVAVLFSGGKDSAFALWYAQLQGWDVTSLVTVVSASEDSWMFHYPAIRWTKLQAQAIGIHQTLIPTTGVKEQELDDLSAGLEELTKSTGIDAVVSGAVASEYQRTRLDNICESLSLKSFVPLWHKNQEQLVEEQITAGFEIILTSCSALGLNVSWLGRKLGQPELEELVKLNRRYGLSVAFEGGEAETFVLAGPIFKGRLSLIRATPRWSADSGHLEMEEVRFENASRSS